jgi:hypothetical protein
MGVDNNTLPTLKNNTSLKYVFYYPIAPSFLVVDKHCGQTDSLYTGLLKALIE